LVRIPWRFSQPIHSCPPFVDTNIASSPEGAAAFASSAEISADRDPDDDTADGDGELDPSEDTPTKSNPTTKSRKNVMT
jgi:hypothetical protein